MDGMQTHWWHLSNENASIPEEGGTVSFSFNYAPVSAIAQLGVAGFAPLLITNAHSIYPSFTHCTWIDGSGKTHVEDLNTHDSSAFPVDIARSGMTNITGEIDITAMMGRIVFNIFFWPSVY